MALKQWHSRNGEKWHKYGLKLRQQQRKAQIQLKNTHSDMALISSFYVKEQVFKFRLGTYSTPQEALLHIRHCLRNCTHSFWGGTKTWHLKRAAEKAEPMLRATLYTIRGGVRLVLVLFLHGWWNAFYVPKMCIPSFFLGQRKKSFPEQNLWEVQTVYARLLIPNC